MSGYTVVFDLDGTLADTSGDLIAAANACFHAMGEGDVLDAATDAGTALRGGRAMLTLGFERLGRDVAGIDPWYPRLLEAYDGAIDVHTVLYDGAMDAVRAIKSAGHHVGICTNKPEDLAEKLMASLGVRDEFGALLGADTLPVRKPDPEHFVQTVAQLGGDVSRSCLIGDTATDHNTARNAGVPSVLVTFGPGAIDVRALDPDHLLDHYSALPALVQQLSG